MIHDSTRTWTGRPRDESEPGAGLFVSATSLVMIFCGWFLALAASHWRRREPGGTLSALVVLALMTPALVVTLLYFRAYRPPSHRAIQGDIVGALTTSIQFLGIGFGPAAIILWPWSGLVVVVLFLSRGNRQSPAARGMTRTPGQDESSHFSPRGLGLEQHRHRLLAGSLGGRIAAEHGRELLDPLGLAQRRDGGARPASFDSLADHPLVMCVAGHLGKMSHADHLMVASQLGERLAQCRAEPAADAGVDLVEDERGDAIDGREHGLGRERESGQLASRGDLAQRARLLARIGREENLDAVGTRFRRGRRPRDRRPALGFQLRP